MTPREKRWSFWAGIVIVLDIALPFGPLKHTGTLGGAFLAWVLLTLAVVASGLAATASWGRSTEKGNRP